MTPIVWVFIMTITDTRFGCETVTKVEMPSLRACVIERNASIAKHIKHEDYVIVKVGCYQKGS